MKLKRDLIIAAGIMVLVVFGITNISFENSQFISIQQTIENFQEKDNSERSLSTNGIVVQQAKEIVKTECDPGIWSNWTNLTPEEKFNKNGLAKAEQTTSLINSKIEIELYINEALTDQEEITATAWHECGHAKSYNIPSDMIQEFSVEILNNFNECKGFEDECLADSMAEYKTGVSETNGYLGKPSTPEQLTTAKKVWETTGIAKHTQPFKGNNSWIETMEH